MEQQPLYSTTPSDVSVSVKQEPIDDITQSELRGINSDKLLLREQHLSDYSNLTEDDSKSDIPIIDIKLIIDAKEPKICKMCKCEKEEKPTVKSESDNNYDLPEALNQTSVKCEHVPDNKPQLDEVKHGSISTASTEIKYNDKSGADIQLVEVPGEMDCKPESVNNANDVVIPGDSNIQTGVEGTATMSQKPCTLMEIGDTTVKEEHTCDRVPTPLMISRDVQAVLCGGSDAAPDMNVDRDPDVNCSYCSICQVPTEDNESSSCEVCAKNVCHKYSFVHSLGLCSGAPRKNCFPSSVELESQKVVRDDERPNLQASNQQPYKCTVCDKCFPWKIHLTYHMLMHRSERTYKCNICDCSFKRKSQLLGHMRVHSIQRPYECTVHVINVLHGKLT